MLALTINPHRTRSRALLLERFHRTTYGLNESLNCAIRNFNNEIQCFDFGVPREGFHELLRKFSLENRPNLVDYHRNFNMSFYFLKKSTESSTKLRVNGTSVGKRTYLILEIIFD
jgi:hypothetical protein